MDYQLRPPIIISRQYSDYDPADHCSGWHSRDDGLHGPPSQRGLPAHRRRHLHRGPYPRSQQAARDRGFKFWNHRRHVLNIRELQVDFGGVTLKALGWDGYGDGLWFVTDYNRAAFFDQIEVAAGETREFKAVVQCTKPPKELAETNSV